MPRTKKFKKPVTTLNKTGNITPTDDKNTNIPDLSDIMKQIDFAENSRLQMAEKNLSAKKAEIANMINSIKLQINPDVLNMTVGQYRKKLKEEQQAVTATIASVNPTKIPSLTKKSNKMKTAANSTKVVPYHLTEKYNKMLTPVNQQISSSLVVTPKVNPNVSISILRRPNEGECAISLSGSPLLVSNVVNDKTASVNVPMPDGRVMSILPNDGINGTNFILDERARSQLEILTKNLFICLKKQ